MTNEELLDVVKMRLDGYSLEEIGEKYGITRSGVQKAICSISNRDHRGFNAGQDRVYAQIIYPRIRERMEDYKWSCTRLSLDSGVSRPTLYNVLYGDTLKPRLNSQRAIAKALDMSVEEAFGKVKLDGE